MQSALNTDQMEVHRQLIDVTPGIVKLLKRIVPFDKKCEQELTSLAAINVQQKTCGMSQVENIVTETSSSNIGDHKDLQVHIGRTTFQHHRILLIISSMYFDKRSTGHGDTTKTEDVGVFGSVLEYIYAAEVQHRSFDVTSVMIAVDVYMMPDLKRVCTHIPTTESSNTYWCLGLSFNTHHDVTDAFFHGNPNNIRTRQTFSNMPRMIIEAVLKSDTVHIKSEVDICELLLAWISCQITEQREVSMERLLQYIRWSTVNVTYIRRLLHDTTVTLTPTCVAFLSNVLDFHATGVQFTGLLTFPRQSTGVERCMFAVGICDSVLTTRKTLAISLQEKNTIRTLSNIPTKQMQSDIVACVHQNAVYVFGLGTPLNEVWRWDHVGWTRCCDMTRGRRRHGAAVLGGVLYTLGGCDVKAVVLDDVEKLETQTNLCTAVGHLSKPVQSIAGSCTAHNTTIYVFGGADEPSTPVDYVQAYDTATDQCTQLQTGLPQPHYVMRALCWDDSAILIGQHTCCVFDFTSHTWQERPQYATGVRHFGCALDNHTVFVAGGGDLETDSSGTKVWVCTDVVRSTPVHDIIQNRTPYWQHHATLPKPSLLQAYAIITQTKGT